MKKFFLIVSMNQKAAIFLKKTLEEVFEDKLEIKAFSFLDDSQEHLLDFLQKNPKLVMATGTKSYQTLLKYYPEEKCILASRDISAPEYFDKLFLTPKGQKILVVNETRNGTLETIEALQRLGVTNFTYVPYWRGCNTDTQGIDTAVSPGMLHYCPQHITNKVDIGMRNLSIVTFLEILNAFGLNTQYIDKYIGNQKKVLIDTYEKLSIEYKRSTGLKNSLTLINELDEAIISISADNNITGLNAAAETILATTRASALGQSLRIFFADLTLADFATRQEKINTIVTLNSNQFYLTYIPHNNDGPNVGIIILRKVADIQKSEEQVRKMMYQKNKGLVAKYVFTDMLTECESMDKLINDSKVFAETDSTILITGESGTGKEMLAQSIHNHSGRAKKPFIAVNFAALPDNLIESELFGYEEGAFTGAKKSGKKGLFELAHTGTIFLDEIGSASMWIQSRLLRVLEEREIMRLGDTKIIPVDIRVIAATNKDLKKLVKQDKFRSDLYYRINVFQIYLPPLRTRKQSIPALVTALMQKSNYKKSFSKQAMDIILHYDWFGNVRELKNMVEYSCQIAKHSIIQPEELPHDLRSYRPVKEKQSDDGSCEIIYTKLKTLFNIEHIKIIMQLLEQNKNSTRKIGRSQLVSVLQENGINISERNLRTILKNLESHGLLRIGKTKQGTVLSDKGERLLRLIQA